MNVVPEIWGMIRELKTQGSNNERTTFTLVNIDKQELFEELLFGLQQYLPLLNVTNQDEILTCQQVEKLLDISHTTRIDWTSQGLLQSYMIGGKKYYKRSEIFQALTRVETSR